MMKHQTRLDRDIRIEEFRSGRRGKLVIVDENVTYHIYPKIVDNKTYVEMWEGGDSDLVCVWLGAEFGVGFIESNINRWIELRNTYTYSIITNDLTTTVRFKPNI